MYSAQQEEVPPVFHGSDSSFTTPTFRIRFWAAHTLPVPFNPNLSWEDAIKRAAPSGITDQDKWPRTHIAPAGEMYPPVADEPRLIEVTYAYMYAHPMTGIAWRGITPMFPKALRSWAEENNLRPTLPRECMAAAEYDEARYALLGSKFPDGFRIASLHIHDVGFHPNDAWIASHPKFSWDVRKGTCFFSVAVNRKESPRGQYLCLDRLWQGDHFNLGYWFTFMRK